LTYLRVQYPNIQYLNILISRIELPVVQESDTTDDDRRIEAGTIKSIQHFGITVKTFCE